MHNRSWMLEQIKQRGWQALLSFGETGPVLWVTGYFPGTLAVHVPVFLEDDHTEALKGLYNGVSDVLVFTGKQGRA